MNTYIGTKIVRAKPMTRPDYYGFRGWTIVPTNDDEGYLVEYMDGGERNHPEYTGYVSWSPKEQFDKAYVLVGEVQNNCLEPHEVRVLAEQAELSDRLSKLKAFIGSERFGAMPQEDRVLLSLQLGWMEGYSSILAARIDKFLVNADDFALPAQACDLSGEGACEACQ